MSETQDCTEFTGHFMDVRNMWGIHKNLNECFSRSRDRIPIFEHSA